MRICSKFLAGVVLVCVALVFGSYSALAATGLTIQPIKVSHTIDPDGSTSGVISIKNESGEAINVDVTVEDFIPSAGTTNVQFVGRAEGNTTVRDWITLDIPEHFVFEQGESRDIPYVIRAPANAEPGSHFGVAFFKATRLNDQSQLKVGTRVGMLIFVTVPGDQLQSGKVLDFKTKKFLQQGPVPFAIRFENTGSVHFEPKGAITITNIFGKEVGKVEIAGQTVLPTGVRDLSAEWGAAGLLLGRYAAELTIVDGEGNELTANRTVFYIFPLWYVAGFVLAVAILFFLLRFLRNRIKINVSFNSS